MTDTPVISGVRWRELGTFHFHKNRPSPTVTPGNDGRTTVVLRVFFNVQIGGVNEVRARRIVFY